MSEGNSSTTDQVAFRPLGGPYGDQFWPVSRRQIETIEANLGWGLPVDYREHLESVGLTGAFGAYTDTATDSQIDVSVIYGHHPLESIYSVVAWSTEFLEPEPILQFAVGDTGAFYLDREGAVWFEPNQMTPRRIASSFTDFVAGIKKIYR